jgi:thiol:disulfide interchange protein
MMKVGTLGLSLVLGLAFFAGSAVYAQGPAPAGKRQIYPENADPKADIAKGIAQAKREHKRVIIDFGGDWCGDCHVLDIYFHQGPNLALLQKYFVLVHVFITETMDNADHVAVAARYGVPIAKGVPALAIVDGDGKVIYAQKTGQFNDMRHMDPGSVNEFLNRWKG